MPPAPPTNLATLIGALAGTLTTVSFVPQVIKTYRTKRADDVSLGMLVAFATGVALWLVYGLVLDAGAIIVTNTVTLALTVPLVVMKVRYQERRERAQSELQSRR